MNNIDPNITLGYRDVMLVTNGGRRIGYNCCKYALPWDMSSKSSIALASVMIRVASRKVSMVFLQEQDFSRHQPCKTRLLARPESIVSQNSHCETTRIQCSLVNLRQFKREQMSTNVNHGLKFLARSGLRDYSMQL